MDPTFPLVPVANLLTSILVILSLFSSGIRKSFNVGASLLGAWLVVSTLITGIEAIVWRDDAENKAPGWCDFSSHIMAGSTIAIPACSLIIARRLHQIIQLRSVESPTVTEKRLRLFVDLSLGLGLPVVVMGLYYIVQISRFQIIEEVGCAAITASDDGMTILLLNSWTILLPTISIIFYCPRLVWSFYKHQRRLNEFERTDDPSSCTRSRFLRLLLIASFDTLITLPYGILNLAMNVKGGPMSQFWEGWSIVHDPTLWPPHLTPASEWRQNHWYRVMVAFSQWANVVLALAFFVIFGLTSESQALYARAFWAVAGVVGWTRPVRDADSRTSDGPFGGSLKFSYPRQTDEFSESRRSLVIAIGPYEIPRLTKAKSCSAHSNRATYHSNSSSSSSSYASSLYSQDDPFRCSSPLVPIATIPRAELGEKPRKLGIGVGMQRSEDEDSPIDPDMDYMRGAGARATRTRALCRVSAGWKEFGRSEDELLKWPFKESLRSWRDEDEDSGG